MQLLLQFYTDSFETSLVFWSWFEDMRVVLIYSLDYFLLLFSQVELSHFSAIIYNQVNGQGYHVGATPHTVLYRLF